MTSKTAQAEPRHDPSLVLYLVRHGETVYNRENRFCGHSDSPLTSIGIDEAHRNGRALRERLGTGADIRIVSSPLARALETAGIIRAELGRNAVPIETDARLREMSFGAWEGLTIDEIKSRYDGEWMRRVADKWAYAPPGGESYEMVARRAGAWLEGTRGMTLVVTHGVVDRILRGLYGAMSPADICALPEPQNVLFQLKGGRITTL